MNHLGKGAGSAGQHVNTEKCFEGFPTAKGVYRGNKAQEDFSGCGGAAYHDPHTWVPAAKQNGNGLKVETILDEAKRLVYGDRGEDYGHPITDFTRTGRMWAAILDRPFVSPEEVAMCMMAVKISRLCNRPKRDSVVDVAGYAATLQMVMEFKEIK